MYRNSAVMTACAQQAQSWQCVARRQAILNDFEEIQVRHTWHRVKGQGEAYDSGGKTEFI